MDFVVFQVFFVLFIIILEFITLIVSFLTEEGDDNYTLFSRWFKNVVYHLKNMNVSSLLYVLVDAWVSDCVSFCCCHCGIGGFH